MTQIEAEAYFSKLSVIRCRNDLFSLEVYRRMNYALPRFELAIGMG
jgi:hypothetical protein